MAKRRGAPLANQLPSRQQTQKKATRELFSAAGVRGEAPLTTMTATTMKTMITTTTTLKQRKKRRENHARSLQKLSETVQTHSKNDPKMLLNWFENGSNG